MCLLNQVVLFFGCVIKSCDIAELFNGIVLSFIRAFKSRLLIVGISRFRTRRYVVGHMDNKCVVLLRLSDIFAEADG
jgi:hypothetical protein